MNELCSCKKITKKTSIFCQNAVQTEIYLYEIACKRLATRLQLACERLAED